MKNPSCSYSPWRFCTAPCMDWSDTHCRKFWRQMTQKTRLYSEMVTTGALIHGNLSRHLKYNEEEHPIALQLGGSDPGELASCSKLAQEWGYDEINLNCGCPSDRVQNGRFGACLMKSPKSVRDCVSAMREASSLPITIKSRLGVDEQDSYSSLIDFVGTVADGGCEVFIIHARKAWLKGLSPKENREIPPLNYRWVYQLKKDFPNITIVLNGGITNLEDSLSHLENVDGVMLGRSPYQNPWLLEEVDSRIFGYQTAQTLDRHDIATSMLPYIEAQLAKGAKLHHITRHMLGLFQGQPGGRKFRRHLSQNAYKIDACPEVLREALSLCPNETLPGCSFKLAQGS